MKKMIENAYLWIGIIVFVTVVFSQLGKDFDLGKKREKIQFSEFLSHIEAKNIKSLTIEGYDGREIYGQLNDGSYFKTKSVQYPGLVEILRKNDISFQVETSDGFLNLLFNVLISWLPMFLLIGVWIFFMRQMQSGSGKAMGFGRLDAKVFVAKDIKARFKDVQGVEEAKEELEELVFFLKNPNKFLKLGGRIPKGFLLVGPPGTGKTLLARAIAGESGVSFLSISGSNFVEMFVGVGASRVRNLFQEAKKNSPCLIFIDEIDAVGRHRGSGVGGGNDEREQTLNQLLVEMDGFEANEGVIIIAATNRPDVLDNALMRPGRFDRQVVIPLPDIKGREKILGVHMKNVPCDDSGNSPVSSPSSLAIRLR